MRPTTTQIGPLTTAAPTKNFVPEESGWYHLVVGAGASDDFGSGTVGVTQCNRTLPDLSAVASSDEGHYLVHLIGGLAVTFTLAGSTDASVLLVISLDPEWPRIH